MQFPILGHVDVVFGGSSAAVWTGFGLDRDCLKISYRQIFH